MQIPLLPDTTTWNMFPVVETATLDNPDLSFLDEISVGNKELFDSLQMEDYQIFSGETPVSEAFNISLPKNLMNLSCEDNVPFPLDLHQVLQSSEFETSNLIQGFPIEKPGPLEQSSSSCDLSSVSELTDQSLLPDNALENEIFLDNMDCQPSCSAEKKYLQMRKQNNIASQRSRKIRKLKNQEMIDKLKMLEEENSKLTVQATELEKQRDALQNQLLKILSKK